MQPAKESGHAFEWLLLVIGALLSLYVTVVFERRKRFAELLRDVARERQYKQPEAYPMSTGPKDLDHARTNAVELWHFLENKEWTLAADGHQEAAKAISRLRAFIYGMATCIEHLRDGKTLSLRPDQYLAKFQLDYNRIKDKEFIRYETSIRPSIWALLRPWAHPVLPDERRDSGAQYFGDLL